MLLDEKQIALNELVVAYREAADHFTDAIQHLGDAELKMLFETIRDRHNKAADSISEEVRKTGVLPRAQHADREQFHQIVTHLKAAFSEDDRQVFLRDRIDNEQSIRLLIAEALKLNVPEETHVLLEQLLMAEAEILAKLNEALEHCTPC